MTRPSTTDRVALAVGAAVGLWLFYRAAMRGI